MSEYALRVESTNPDVVAFAPMAASPHPRVIAVGSGKGQLLRVSFGPPDACGRHEVAGGGGTGPGGVRKPVQSTMLSETAAEVQVDFSSSPYSVEQFVQNDGGGGASVGGSGVLNVGPPRDKKDRNKDSAGGEFLLYTPDFSRFHFHKYIFVRRLTAHKRSHPTFGGFEK
jgi:transmembrane protein 132